MARHTHDRGLHACQGTHVYTNVKVDEVPPQNKSLAIVMADIVMAYIVMADTVMAYTVMAYTGMAYVVMAHAPERSGEVDGSGQPPHRSAIHVYRHVLQNMCAGTCSNMCCTDTRPDMHTHMS